MATCVSLHYGKVATLLDPSGWPGKLLVTWYLLRMESS